MHAGARAHALDDQGVTMGGRKTQRAWKGFGAEVWAIHALRRCEKKNKDRWKTHENGDLEDDEDLKRLDCSERGWSTTKIPKQMVRRG